MNEYRLLICTVGGTPEAIAAAIKGSTPERVIFVVSPETSGDVEKGVLPLLQKEEVILTAGQYDYFQVPDAQDFITCVESLRALGDDVSKWRKRGEEFTVLVDFTGGTKCMSASLALVARQWQCRFSYIGGTQRNKGGVGVVVSGAEKIMHFQNPWDALGYQVVEDAITLFDQGNYEASVQILDRSKRQIERPDIKQELNTFGCLAQAYLDWDRFDHERADRCLADVQKSANHLRHLFLGTGEDILQTVSIHHRFLSELRKGIVSRHILLDLCANARRCADKGRYDDAVARLYRAVEAIAQFRLHTGYNMYQCDDNGMPDFSRIEINRVPASTRPYWAKRTREDGTMALSLQDNYRLLSDMEDTLGERFSLLQGKESPLAARNQSILAHGFIPVGEKVFRDLWQKALALAEIEEKELPVFPQVSPSVRENRENTQKQPDLTVEKGGARKTKLKSGVAERKE